MTHGVGHAQASDTALTLGSGPTMHSRERGYIKERGGEKGSERREDDAEQGGRRKKDPRSLTLSKFISYSALRQSHASFPPLNPSLILPSPHTLHFLTRRLITFWKKIMESNCSSILHLIFPRHAHAARRVLVRLLTPPLVALHHSYVSTLRLGRSAAMDARKAYDTVPVQYV